jgi:hypothetical protein
MSPTRLLPLVLTLALFASACHVLISPWAPGGASRPFYCDPTDTAINDGHGHMDPSMPPSEFMLAYTEPKGPLSAADCESVATDLEAANTFVSQLGTVAEVEAAGWKQAAVWSSGQGVHYVDPDRLAGPFDPQEPNWLMYDGTAPDSELTGMMFLTTTTGLAPPAGFAGANDHFHQHAPLCTSTTAGAYPFIIGEHLTDAECNAIGGVNLVYDAWMVHVWITGYDGWQATDIFNKTHPSLP